MTLVDDDANELAFLLSSRGRLEMLSLLGVERLRLSAVASKLKMTVQETSRQLARLEKANLVERGSRGLYELTDSGRVFLTLAPPFDFLTKNREYLRTHNLSFLPHEFLERIGELSEGEYSNNIAAIIEHVRGVVSSAHEHIWLMADQALMLDFMAERMASAEDNLSWRILIPAAVVRQVNYQDLPELPSSRVELRVVEKVEVGISLNEKIAGVTFPDATGKVDFDCGLHGSNPLFHKWCGDLFAFNWEHSRKT